MTLHTRESVLSLAHEQHRAFAYEDAVDTLQSAVSSCTTGDRAIISRELSRNLLKTHDVAGAKHWAEFALDCYGMTLKDAVESEDPEVSSTVIRYAKAMYCDGQIEEANDLLEGLQETYPVVMNGRLEPYVLPLSAGQVLCGRYSQAIRQVGASLPYIVRGKVRDAPSVMQVAEKNKRRIAKPQEIVMLGKCCLILRATALSAMNCQNGATRDAMRVFW